MKISDVEPVVVQVNHRGNWVFVLIHILEYAWGEVDWRAQLLDPPERIEAGYLILPEGPGLGHRLNQATLAAHALFISP